jgi:hypothetical protein
MSRISRPSAYMRPNSETTTHERECPPPLMSSEHDFDYFDSDPERMINPSSHTRECEGNQSMPRARPRSGGNMRSCDQVTTDPGAQQKRRLCEDIALLIRGASKKKKREQVHIIIFGDY